MSEDSEMPSARISPSLDDLGLDSGDRLEAILSPIDSLIELEPFALDVEAVRFAGLTNVPGTSGRRFVDELGEMSPERDIRVIDALHLLSVYGGEQAAKAGVLIEMAGVQPSTHLGTVGQMSLEEAWNVGHPGSARHEICFVVSYVDTGSSLVTVLVNDDHHGAANKVGALPDAAEARKRILATDGYSLDIVSLSSAKTQMSDALARADELPTASPFVEESLLIYRPLLDYLLAHR